MNTMMATSEHEEIVLELLSEFQAACVAIVSPNKTYLPANKNKKSGTIYKTVIDSPASAVFLVKEKDVYIGIATVHKVPQIRKGGYCAEIEEMFVKSEYQGTGAAAVLINAVEAWAKKSDIINIRLESSNELLRAHKFYEKMGFSHYGRAYIKTFN